MRLEFHIFNVFQNVILVLIFFFQPSEHLRHVPGLQAIGEQTAGLCTHLPDGGVPLKFHVRVFERRLEGTSLPSLAPGSGTA